MAANILSGFINLVRELWGLLAPILIAIGAGIVLYLINTLYTSMMLLAGNITLWYMANTAMVSNIAIIAGVMFAMQALGITFEDVFSFIGGAIGFMGVLLMNLGKVIINFFLGIVDVVNTVFTAAVNLVLKGVNKLISALNKIPGVDLNSVDDNWGGLIKDVKYFEYGNEMDGFRAGSAKGKSLYNKGVTALTGAGAGGGFDMSKFGTNAAPLTVKGKGDGGKVDVKMDKEDLQYLRDLAEREFVNKFSSATLAPNIQITFGDVHEEADANKVAGRIKKILQEEIATVAEGVY